MTTTTIPTATEIEECREFVRSAFEFWLYATPYEEAKEPESTELRDKLARVEAVLNFASQEALP